MKASFYTVATALAITLAASAQNAPDTGLTLDALEDTANVVTITDIITIQEQVSYLNSNDEHFKKVWGYKSYFNLGYNYASTLTPKEDIPSGLTETEYVEPFRSDWAASLTLGHSYPLHKKPIANTLVFNIDWTFINFAANHFAAHSGDKLYNSSLTYKHKDPDDGTTNDYHYLPWKMEKYEFNYDMEVGPSITVAPFNYIKYRPVHFLRFNIYYHIGYEVSLMTMGYNKKVDANEDIISEKYKEYNKSTKIVWGHGLTSTFGLSMNWKTIGFGWETRTNSPRFQSLQAEMFGSAVYKFKQTANRIYLQIRY